MEGFRFGAVLKLVDVFGGRGISNALGFLSSRPVGPGTAVATSICWKNA